jgi:uncharacterized protein (DUF2252 family)
MNGLRNHHDGNVFREFGDAWNEEGNVTERTEDNDTGKCAFVDFLRLALSLRLLSRESKSREYIW